jgi:hypothetical protein
LCCAVAFLCCVVLYSGPSPANGNEDRGPIPGCARAWGRREPLESPVRAPAHCCELLYCVVLCCVVLRGAVLCCVVLCGVVLYCAVLCCVVWPSPVNGNEDRGPLPGCARTWGRRGPCESPATTPAHGCAVLCCVVLCVLCRVVLCCVVLCVVCGGPGEPEQDRPGLEEWAGPPVQPKGLRRGLRMSTMAPGPQHRGKGQQGSTYCLAKQEQTFV